MKKFLLSLATFAMASSAMAIETVDFDFVNETYGLERLSGNTQVYIEDGTSISQTPVTLTFANSGASGSNKSGCRLWKDGLRMYNGGTITVSVPEGYTLKQVSTTCTAATLKVNDIVFNNLNPWFKTAGAQEITIAYTADKNNTVLPDLKVQYDIVDLGGKESAGLIFNGSSFIAGENTVFTKAVLTNPHNLPVTWTSSDETVAVVSEGTVNVLSVGTTVITASTAETDKYIAGKASYTLTVVPSANTLPQMLSKAPNKGDKILMNGELTVVYVNGQNVYVIDAYDNPGLLYGSNSYEKGDLLNGGWEAVNSIYNGLIEWGGTFPSVKDSNELSVHYPSAESVSNNDINKVLILKNVTFSKATPVRDGKDNKNAENFTGILESGAEMTFRTNFNIDSVEAGKYDVLCAVAIYNNTLQIYPIEYTEADDSVGVENIEAVDSEAVYYNLQGVMVENPAAGIYVKVANGKAEKVVIK